MVGSRNILVEEVPEPGTQLPGEYIRVRMSRSLISFAADRKIIANSGSGRMAGKVSRNPSLIPISRDRPGQDRGGNHPQDQGHRAPSLHGQCRGYAVNHVDHRGAGGVDFSIEASGRVETMEMAFEVVCPGGGLCVLVGNLSLCIVLQLGKWRWIARCWMRKSGEAG